MQMSVKHPSMEEDNELAHDTIGTLGRYSINARAIAPSTTSILQQCKCIVGSGMPSVKGLGRSYRFWDDSGHFMFFFKYKVNGSILLNPIEVYAIH